MSSRNLQKQRTVSFQKWHISFWPKTDKRKTRVAICMGFKMLPSSPVSSIQPRHTEGLKHHHNDEGQSGRVVIEHRHKVVPTTLGEEKANNKANDAAENCKKKKNRTEMSGWNITICGLSWIILAGKFTTFAPHLHEGFSEINVGLLGWQPQGSEVRLYCWKVLHEQHKIDADTLRKVVKAIALWFKTWILVVQMLISRIFQESRMNIKTELIYFIRISFFWLCVIN